MINAQENKTNGSRQSSFGKNELNDIKSIKVYVLEVNENRKLGKEVKFKRTIVFVISQLLGDKINNTEFKICFNKQLLGKQRKYADCIVEAK